ncbi:XRE family transcriptional regulator [Clostridium autoethanogenum]|uniref:XRE family transcriptional regulator n=1 Tax=Clostridium autoethanogenum TaxID=84023 RepID=A0A3M0T2T9_9CLOT|nr:helix-turn-helix transcriptional regulator [Clostridium autoethanogenum]RMD04940.1 XRE family transcriptional regulator [Clostridium autoethanogenum]
MKFGNILSDLRNKAHITQKDLANILGVSRGTIGMYEIGQRDPDTETLKKISDYFNVSVDYLLGRTDKKESEPEIDIPQEYSDKYKVTKKDIKQHDEVLEHAQAFMMDDKVGEEDKEKLVAVINKLYWDSKAKNKEKFGRKKKKE